MTYRYVVFRFKKNGSRHGCVFLPKVPYAWDTKQVSSAAASIWQLPAPMCVIACVRAFARWVQRRRLGYQHETAFLYISSISISISIFMKYQRGRDFSEKEQKTVSPSMLLKKERAFHLSPTKRTGCAALAVGEV